MDPGPAHKRRRPAVACTECRRRKIRCDRASPCGPCSKAQSSLRCVYSTSSSPRQNHGQLNLGPELPEENLLDLDFFDLDSQTLHDGIDLNCLTGLDGADSPPALGNHLYSSQFHNNKEPPWMGTNLSSTETCCYQMGSEPVQQPSLSEGSSASSEVQFFAELGDSNHESPWYEPFTRCESLRFILQGLTGRPQDHNFLRRPEHEMVRPLKEMFAGLDRVTRDERESRALAVVLRANAPSIGFAAWDLLPSRQVCDALLGAYIKTFESVLRILHVPSFLGDYERIWKSPTSRSMDADNVFLCKLLVAIALGSCVCVHPSVSISVAPDQVSGWIAHVRQWCANKMVVHSSANLDMAQIACLLAWARHTQHHSASSTGSTWFPVDHDLTRMALQMGLHREVRARSPAMPAEEVEMRRRLWATMLELSLQLCFDEGLPAPLASESYDCETPSSIADEDLTMGAVSPDRSNFTPSTILMLLARTQRLRLRILHIVNAPGVSKDYDEGHRLAAELNAVCGANMDMLRSIKTPKPTRFQTKLLDLFTRPFVLALHEQFPDQAVTKSSDYYSRRMRMEAAAQILANPLLSVPTLAKHPVSDLGFAEALSRSPSPSTTRPFAAKSTALERDAYAALCIRGHGHFALVQRQATMVLCLDLISELEENAFPITDGACRRQLRDVVRGGVRVFERRVRAAGGTHSTREFLIFTCASTYIDAMLRGCQAREIDEAVVEAARAALAVCHKVMGRPPSQQGARSERSGEGRSEEDVQLWMLGDGQRG
ncbi:uncharacterized protein BP5553_09149 [Venustampulla echinocandica]|uniref:Zn(2)-C6 fungal-type domain-containing protein n=1 Tax=Venustampulla echinocandica TaxID=2656787 RepID=A0A370TDY8_9HELO|nr:uncharacterized protein BP5553_09149 [Venustampulla echinocandica]RDL32693.1 hypothetical protein BP5553_09149 [Venustampulla echinocandica]